MAAVLEVRELTKVYKMGDNEVHALRGVTLVVNKGEFVAVMGPSGCGKSTFLQIAGMLDRPTNGRVLLDGSDVSKMSDADLAKLRREKIGFIYQSFNLLPQESAKGNVELPLEYAGISPKEREKRAIHALEAVGLGDRMDNKPNQLSGGQRQRVAIARALVNEPTLILADEPTGALDSKSGTEVMGILNKLNKEGHTIVMVTHHPDHWRQATRRVDFLDGKITGDRPVTAAEAAGGEKPQEAAPQQLAPWQIGSNAPVQARPVSPAMMGQVCAKCNTENRPIAKYCRACGFKMNLTPSQTQELRMRLAGVDLTCQNCGQLNRPIAKFCGRCGSRTINSFAPQPAGFAP